MKNDIFTEIRNLNEKLGVDDDTDLTEDNKTETIHYETGNWYADNSGKNTMLFRIVEVEPEIRVTCHVIQCDDKVNYSVIIQEVRHGEAIYPYHHQMVVILDRKHLLDSINRLIDEYIKEEIKP